MEIAHYDPVASSPIRVSVVTWVTASTCRHGVAVADSAQSGKGSRQVTPFASDSAGPGRGGGSDLARGNGRADQRLAVIRPHQVAALR